MKTYIIYTVILKGKVAIVTGSSRGIGAATVKLLAKEGAAVVVNYLKNETEAKKIVTEIQGFGGKAIAVQADVSSPEDVERMVQTAVKEFSKVDILVNNAHRPFSPKSFLDLDWRDFEGQIEGTVKSAFLCCQAVVKMMIEQKSGKIINIISTSVDYPELGFYARDTAKAALIGLTRNLALELAPYGITVNMISPGWTLTDQAENFPKELKEKALSRIPMKRFANPDDIARAVLFYASDWSNFVTGTYLPVCGGAVIT